MKTIKAVLGKLYFNNWIKDNFWRNIHIKIDKEVNAATKECNTKECNIKKLFHLIDRSTFIGFRDTVAIKLMFKFRQFMMKELDLKRTTFYKIINEHGTSDKSVQH
ncbi:hypothetical protein [Viridibacillus arvi]|uniref:hypothetical protein n=1 Tax=Viridibacillus arvi TaxID=263475 RepID=UPI00381C4CAA